MCAQDPSRKHSLPKSTGGPDDRYTISNRHDDDLTAGTSLTLSAKAEKAKQALIAMLPPYDQLNKILNNNSEWWQTWRRKCSGTSGPEQSLPQFAANALTTGHVGALGTVVLSVGICTSDESSDVDRYIEAVDRWVLADDEYAASLEGIECLILKSKWYADVGQPRRAWIAYRKGLMYAQLMVSLLLHGPSKVLTFDRVSTVNALHQQPTRVSGGHSTTATASFLSSLAFHTALATPIAI